MQLFRQILKMSSLFHKLHIIYIYSYTISFNNVTTMKKRQFKRYAGCILLLTNSKNQKQGKTKNTTITAVYKKTEQQIL